METKILGPGCIHQREVKSVGKIPKKEDILKWIKKWPKPYIFPASLETLSRQALKIISDNEVE